MQLELKKGAKRGARYDFHVCEEGKSLAVWRAATYERAWSLWVEGYGPIRQPKDKNYPHRGSEALYRVQSKEQMLDTFEAARHANRIPNEQEIIATKAEKEAKDKARSEAIEQSHREERIRDAAPALLTALERTAYALELAFSNRPLRDMSETLAEAKAAIAKARGLDQL